MKKLLVLIGLVCLFVIPTANAKPEASAVYAGYVYYGDNYGGGPVANALVTISGSCGSHQFRTAANGRWPTNGGGIVVNAPCHVSIAASSGGCIQYYADTINFDIAPGQDLTFYSYERHSVRVCNIPTKAQ